MTRIAVAALCCLVLSALAGAAGVGTPAAVAHLAFAGGIVPLIFAAMIHFVPVLTRTGDAPAAVRRLPWLAQASGGLAVAGFFGILPYPAVFLAACLDLGLAAALLAWIVRRARAALGTPHPGWRWYAAAVLLLMTALLAVLAMGIWPEHWLSWRRLHLHLNTLGLVGLAAFGTLPLLLPTALGQPDPQAAGWLRRRLWPQVAAVLLLAVGSALYWPLAVAGAAILVVIALGLVAHWLRRFKAGALLGDGAVAALLAAVCGWLLCLFAGALHGAGVIAARPTLAAWAAAFLLPLVSGALTQLLPVWRHPGVRTPARDAMRDCLAVGGRWRSLLFFAAGLAFIADAAMPAGLLVGSALGWFVLRLIMAMRFARPTR